MVAIGIGSAMYIGLGYFDNQSDFRRTKSKTTVRQKYSRLPHPFVFAGIIGIAFSLSAGPSIAALVLVGSNPITAILAVSLSVSIGLVVAASVFYTIPLIYWQAALKPEAIMNIPRLN